MKRTLFPLLALVFLHATLQAGSETYGSKDTAPMQSCPNWYADSEWNLGAWSTYAFTAERYRNDTYIEADHAWGGGLALKYFFHRYFGIGVEGWAVEATRQQFDGTILRPAGEGFAFVPMFIRDSRTISSVLGTFTLRYPIACTRFAPYLWAGGGAIFGGGQRDKPFRGITIPEARPETHSGSESKAAGQFGAGLEVRLTPHIGLTNDFSWNVINGPSNNFGMVRTGINFAF